jgi:hypothetical protein
MPCDEIGHSLFDWVPRKFVSVQDSVTSYPEVTDVASSSEKPFPIPSSQQTPDTETPFWHKAGRFARRPGSSIRRDIGCD